MRELVAFTEQRCWVAGGRLAGRQPLGALRLLSRAVPIRVIARTGPPEQSGVAVLPEASGHQLLAWPSTVRGLPVLVRTLAQVWSAVGRSGAVVVYLPGVVGMVGGWVAVLRRRPLTVIAVGDPAESLSRAVLPGAEGALLRRLLTGSMRALCQRANVVRYVTARVLQRRYPPGPQARVFAVTDVAELTAYPPRPHPGPGPLTVLSVGSLEQPYKGVDDLIEAVSQLVTEGMDVHLRVAGTGRLAGPLTERAKSLLGGRAQFLGHLAPQNLAKDYRDADCFVLASWTEGMPRVLLEAMASGLPVVATAVGGVPEVLEPHRLVVPRDPAGLARALQALVEDPQAWADSAVHNRRTVDAVLRDARNREPEFAAAVAATFGATPPAFASPSTGAAVQS